MAFWSAAARRRFKREQSDYVQVVSSETVLGAPHPFKAVSSVRVTALHIARPTPICVIGG